MDNALGPREIQARIRSGRSIDEVTEIADLPRDKVERFAAPVLAEREYVAQQAMGAPVRRRGETSGHRKLRVAVAERLSPRHVDVDDVTWDSARMEDGRWAVTALVRVEETERRAVFHYDVPGRFSVAGNDDARWFLGESASGADADEEPTVDLNDDLAIVRSVSRPSADEQPAAAEGQGSAQANDDNVVALRGERPSAASSHTAPRQPEADDESVSAPEASSEGEGPQEGEATQENGSPQHSEADSETGEPDPATTDPATEPGLGGLDILYDILDRAGTEFTEDSVEILRREAGADKPNGADTATAETDETATLGTDETVVPGAHETAAPEPGTAVETEESESGRTGAVDAVNATPEPEEPAAEEPAAEDPVVEDLAGDDVSDAAAVPDTGSGEFEAQAPPPPYPVEPSLFDDDPEVSAQLATGAEPPARTEHVTGPPGGPAEDAAPATDQGTPAKTPGNNAAGKRARRKGRRTTGNKATSTAKPSTPADGSGADQATRSADAPPDAATTAPPEQPAPAAEPEETTAEEPKPAPKKRSRKRASVPSWDEIMFGSPRSKH